MKKMKNYLKKFLIVYVIVYVIFGAMSSCFARSYDAACR